MKKVSINFKLLLVTVFLGLTAIVAVLISNRTSSVPLIMQIGFDWQRWEEYNGIVEFDWTSFDSADPTAYIPSNPIPPSFTAEHVHSIATLSFVDFYYYSTSIVLESFNLTWHSNEARPPKGHPYSHMITGISSNSLMQFGHNAINLTAGRKFTKSEMSVSDDSSVIIISEALAQANDLTIGSTFELYRIIRFPEESQTRGFTTLDSENPHWFDDEFVYARISMEFEVVGLYEVTGYEDGQVSQNTLYVPNLVIDVMKNKIAVATLSSWNYVDYELPKDLSQELHNDLQGIPVDNAFFSLRDTVDVDVFVKEARPLLPHDFYYFVEFFGNP